VANKELKRKNHYVPIWYQKGFTNNSESIIQYLDLEDKTIETPKGKIIVTSTPKNTSVKKAFFIKDLYSTFFGNFISDEIEDKLFGSIDSEGSLAVRAFIKNESKDIHERFIDFFQFIDIQKLRTPKGLDWIKNNYSDLNHNELLIEMQSLMKINITLWTEGIREIVSAKDSDVKFILSDHPVTTYNYACSPEEIDSRYPYEPPISLKATHTIFPLNLNECLILTNFEFADDSDNVDPKEKRTNPNYFRETVVNTLNMIRKRNFDKNDVTKINYIIKKRAKRYIAAGKKEWLYPERNIKNNWHDFKSLLLPPKEEIGIFGGEMFMKFEDGSTKYQDAFGRETPKRAFLQKSIKESEIKPNDYCGCGSVEKYKNCCKNVDKNKRSSWKELSIRERNIILTNGILDILGISKGKNWNDVRKKLKPQQVKEIYELYEYLWPLDTDILSLLAKKNNKLRVLYSGIVNTFTVDALITSLTFYFDEVIIQNPIMHPSKMKEEFSPIHHPEKYLDQTLKFAYLIIKLAPYIENGLINLIPDPGVFNRHLSLSSLNLSEERYKENDIEIDIKKEDPISQQNMEEYKKRMFLGLSKDKAISMIKSHNPGIEKEEIEVLLKEYTKLSESDPLVILQENRFDNEGQIEMLNFSPTFEMAMFICQLTGAILITHGNRRWKDIQEAQFKNYGFPTYSYQKLTNFINNYNFVISQNTDFIRENRNNKSLICLRELFSEINNYISNDSRATNKKFTKNFKSRFIKNNNKYIHEFKEKEQTMYNCKFEFLIPNNGIVNKKVQRLIIQNTSEQYSMNVPIAIFISI